jgi:hypothetical protein
VKSESEGINCHADIDSKNFKIMKISFSLLTVSFSLNQRGRRNEINQAYYLLLCCAVPAGRGVWQIGAGRCNGVKARSIQNG